MNLKNWVYQHYGNTHLYYTPLPGVVVNADLRASETWRDCWNPFDDAGRVVGFLYSLGEHEVSKVWVEHSIEGIVEVGAGAVVSCSDDELRRLLTKVKV